MSLIREILSPENVLLDMEAANKKRVFEQVGLIVENKFNIARSDIFSCLLDREKLGSTGLGHGIAIPHGRAQGLKEIFGLFIRLKAPIPFDAPDGKPVQCLFVLLVPENATKKHLQVLSALAQRFSSKVLRGELMTVQTSDKAYQLLTTETK